ncbi:rhodanese-like domain-containing protein [Acidovorax sp. NPDC077693]|uniref:rhodanese-like domain-containing protein n=1 Tax=unclassified Acidovorax TaxID=2684926 RepID=UPI0037C51E2C
MKSRTWVDSACSALTCVLLVCLTIAQAQESDEAAAACLRTDHREEPDPVSFEHLPLPAYSSEQASCWAGVEALKDASLMVLDVREQDAAATSVIGGATPMALSAVADKSYLKPQRLLLVGTGVDLRSLTQTCVALRSKGFGDVHVLLGGASTWSKEPQASWTSAQHAWLGSGEGLWRIAAVGFSARQLRSLPQPAAVQLPAGANAFDLRRAMSANAAANPLQRPTQWLVVGADPAAAQALFTDWFASDASGFSAQTGNSVKWLAGGWSAYEAYIAQQKILAAHAGRPLPRNCGS